VIARLVFLFITLLPVTLAGQSTTLSAGLHVQTIQGQNWNLTDQHGRWVVVNFWATWCSPCLKEMPELSQLHTHNAAVAVIGLAYEEIENAQMVAFLAQHPVSYPIAIIDPFAPLAGFDTPRVLPMTLLFAPNGTLVQQFLGPVTAQTLEHAIAENEGKTL